MKVYAKIFIIPNSEGSDWSTPVDKEGKTNPKWNFKVKCLIPEDAVQHEDQRDELVIKLHCRKSLKEDKYVGEVNIPLKELFDGGLARENLEYEVYRNDAEGTFGTLKLSYRFGDSTQKIDEQETPISTGGQSSSTGGGQGNERKIHRILRHASGVADAMNIALAIANAEEFIRGLFHDGEQQPSE